MKNEFQLSDYTEMKWIDFKVCLAIQSLGSVGIPVKLDEVVPLAGRSRSSICRSIRRSKSLGVLNSKRRGPYEYEYTFSKAFRSAASSIEEAVKEKATLLSESLPEELLKSDMTLKIPEANRAIQLENSTRGETLKSDMTLKKPKRFEPVRKSDMSLRLRSNSYITNKEYNRSILDNDLSLSSNCLIESYTLSLLRVCAKSDMTDSRDFLGTSVGKSETSLSMPKAVGPDGPMKDIANAVFSRSRIKKKPQPQLTPKKPKMNNRQRMEQKQVSEYNCHDMEIVFKDAWPRKWVALPQKWTTREYHHIKQMIEEQGAEHIVTVLKYTIKNWDDILTRYRDVGGLPNPRIIFAYRSSWVPEALGDVSTKRKWGAEYTGPKTVLETNSDIDFDALLSERTSASRRKLSSVS